MMLHSRNALSRQLLRPSLISPSSSVTKLSTPTSFTLSSQCNSTSTKGRRTKDIFPASSPMIDEPVDQIHKRMSKLTFDFKNKDKVDKFTKTFMATPDIDATPEPVAKPVSSSLFVGHVVEFVHRDCFEIGYVSSANVKSITVTTVDNQEIKIHSSQVVNVWSNDVGKVSLEELKALHSKLPSFLESQPIRKRDITDAWKKLNIFVKVPYTSTLLSKILFNTTSPISVYATFKMMAASPYFRRWDQSNTGYKIYNSEGLKGTKMAQFINKIQRKLAGEASGATLLPNWDVLVDTVFRDDLITFANKGLAAPSKSRATAKFVLQGLKREYTPEAASELLQALGLPLAESKTADPAFIAAKAQADAIASHVKQLGGKFTEISEGKAKKSKKSKQAATSAEYKDSDVETRENLTHHAVVVVDTNAFAADTGVSMRVSEDGSKATIYLHAADPTRWVKTSDPISMHAYSSANTLYLPNATQHMLPKSFLESTALSNERENYCLTLALEVDANTGALQNYEIFPSITTKVIQSTYKTADRLMAGDVQQGENVFDSNTAEHVSSLLQNLQSLKEARMENAPYDEPTVAAFEPDMKSKTGISPSRHASTSFSVLHYVTLLADEAIAKFAAAHDLPLPSPPNFTRPLRTFAGMVTHWQIKAALRNDTLPYNNSQMESMRSWLSQKVARNNQEAADMRDQATQTALRLFFDRQRAVIGNSEVLLTAQVLKTNPTNRSITITARELRYKSVMNLSAANFARVEVGTDIVVSLREKPTHIGMAFVEIAPKKAPEVTQLPKIATRDTKAPRSINLEEPSTPSTLTAVVHKAASTRSSVTGMPPRMHTTITRPIQSNTVRFYSTDSNNNNNIPAGKKIALAQVGNVGDDFSTSAAPFEPYMYDVDPEDLIPRAPRVPVPPKPSRALKSRSRSMILNPIRREEDSTPLPEGSPTHIAIPASVARAQAAAAAKAAAKEAKEQAKAAAKAAKAGGKKGDAAKTDSAASATSSATPASESGSGESTPVSTPSAGSAPATHGSTGPLGTTSQSSTTTVAGTPPSSNPPSQSFSTRSYLSTYRPFIMSSPTSLTITRGYATGKSPVSPPPSTKAGKDKQAPVADEDADDEDDLREDDDDELNEDDDRINEDEDEDDEGKDEDEDEDEDDEKDEDEDEDDDEDGDDEDKDFDEDEEGEDFEDEDGDDEIGRYNAFEVEEGSGNKGRNFGGRFGGNENDEDDDVLAEEDDEFDIEDGDVPEPTKNAKGVFNDPELASLTELGLAAAAATAAAKVASPSAQANVAPESAAPPKTPAAVKETKKEEVKEEVKAEPKRRGRKPKAQKEEEEDEESDVEEKPKPKGRGRPKAK